MLDREAVIAWYRRNRERTRMLFDLVAGGGAEGDGAYYKRPIALRHPIVFYEGHLPAFSFNTLVKKGLGGPSIDARLEALFARGIDPHEAAGPPEGGPHVSDGGPRDKDDRAGWPSRAEVHAFAAEADRRVLDALCRADLERPGHPLLDRAEAVFTILEHEAMHQETLLYMWHRLPFGDKHRPQADKADLIRSAPLLPGQEWVEIPGGRATLGVDRDELIFGWDNEFPRHVAEVAAFSIERLNVTNAQFLEFVDAGGYTDRRWWREEDWNWIQNEQIAHPLFWEHGDGSDGRTEGLRHNNTSGWSWRGMFDRFPLPLSWPVYVSHAEAAAYARWRHARLPTEAEYQRAAYGSPDGERPYPWGSDPPSNEHGVFDRLRASGASAFAKAPADRRSLGGGWSASLAGARDQVARAETDFSSYDPEPAGSHPAGRSAWGVDDLVGNGWEWTSTVFGPFPGFRAMASYPEYSADFFDGEHMVLKGASPVTAAELLRPTFRNWFRRRYPYVYATFRCVRERSARS
ncbi:MAG TPA: SUMF1/EgtB/PvdO family nonheme iron enzyme [Vicinamibacterales bacterium]|jgi:ergothioneine biosynthesis protein EgtB